jgi:hypothetical protein
MMKPSYLRFMGLVAVLWLLVACTATPATPTQSIAAARTPTVSRPAPTPAPSPSATVQPHPPAATLIVAGHTQPAGVGSYCWTESTGAETTVGLCVDKIGIPTAHEPLRIQAPLTATFDLPLATPPQELSLHVIPVTDEDRQPDAIDDWSWWAYGPGELHPLSLTQRPTVVLELEPGLYVLDLFARWQDKGDVGYGFLLQVVGEAGMPEGAFAPASPIATASVIRFAGWSPDSRWVAYWVSSQEDVDNSPPYSFPAGALHLANVEADESCAVPEFMSQDGATIHWSDDGAVIVGTVDGWFTGQPCQDKSYAPLADQAPDDSPAPDPALSPDGLYRAVTALQSSDGGFLTFETTLAASDETQPLQRVTWQIDERLGDYGLGGEWISRNQFLVYETLTQGPLILDVEGNVRPVLSELFSLHQVPSILDEGGYSSRAIAAPGVEPDTFHLLLAGVGLEGNFPSVILFHAENELVETLPHRYVWWTPFSDDHQWLLMDERSDVAGYESHAISIRRVEDSWPAAWTQCCGPLTGARWRSATKKLSPGKPFPTPG